MYREAPQTGESSSGHATGPNVNGECGGVKSGPRERRLGEGMRLLGSDQRFKRLEIADLFVG